MIVNVNVITETSYTVEIPDVPESEEDKLFEELSCESCMGDIMDVEFFLEEKGLYFGTTEEESNSRIETWR